MKPNATIAEALRDPKAKIFATTPVGIAVFPHLLVMDEYQKKENGKFECNTKLRLDPAIPADSDFIDMIQEMSNEAFEEGKLLLQESIDSGELKGKKLADAKKALEELELSEPFDPDYDEDGNETGLVIFKMKTTVEGVDKKTNKRWKREVPIFDSQGKPIKDAARSALKLWGGSRIRVSLEVKPFAAFGLKKAGVSLRISAVQVIELAGSAATASTYGFGEEEGYVAPDAGSVSTDDDYEADNSSDDDEGPEEF